MLLKLPSSSVSKSIPGKGDSADFELDVEPERDLGFVKMFSVIKCVRRALLAFTSQPEVFRFAW